MFARFSQFVRNMIPLKYLDRLQSRDKSYSLRPVCAADKSCLGRLHYFPYPKDARNRITVAQSLAKDHHVRLNTVNPMRAACGYTKPRRYFVKNEHSANTFADGLHLFQKLKSAS